MYKGPVLLRQVSNSSSASSAAAMAAVAAPPPPGSMLVSSLAGRADVSPFAPAAATPFVIKTASAAAPPGAAVAVTGSARCRRLSLEDAAAAAGGRRSCKDAPASAPSAPPQQLPLVTTVPSLISTNPMRRLSMPSWDCQAGGSGLLPAPVPPTAAAASAPQRRGVLARLRSLLSRSSRAWPRVERRSSHPRQPRLTAG